MIQDLVKRGDNLEIVKIGWAVFKNLPHKNQVICDFKTFNYISFWYMVDFNLFKPRPPYGPEINLSLVSKIIIENNKMKVIILSDESHTMILEIGHN